MSNVFKVLNKKKNTVNIKLEYLLLLLTTLM